MTRDLDAIGFADDLIRLEIIVWDRIDARLREGHEVSLAFFEVLRAVSAGAPEGVRVGEVAAALGITVGGTSKLVDRIVAAKLVARRADPDDRRASRLALTAAGRRVLDAASGTYREEVARLLDPVLDPAEQRRMHGFITRLLTAIDHEENP
jgi:MarR family transcriptional regulator, organic hydroperoxide resistance regulator